VAVVQNGMTDYGTPTGIIFVGKLFGEAELLAVAKAYQDATDFRLQHPRLGSMPQQSTNRTST
jgi:Asp-tRNA(Asn)/Glu-tRNA(Gln) amidotransferase A subunit family amidase